MRRTLHAFTLNARGYLIKPPKMLLTLSVLAKRLVLLVNLTVRTVILISPPFPMFYSENNRNTRLYPSILTSTILKWQTLTITSLRDVPFLHKSLTLSILSPHFRSYRYLFQQFNT